MPAGTEALSALREVSAAWRRADLMACEQIGARRGGGGGGKRRQLKGVPEFPRSRRNGVLPTVLADSKSYYRLDVIQLCRSDGYAVSLGSTTHCAPKFFLIYSQSE